MSSWYSCHVDTDSITNERGLAWSFYPKFCYIFPSVSIMHLGWGKNTWSIQVCNVFHVWTWSYYDLSSWQLYFLSDQRILVGKTKHIKAIDTYFQYENMNGNFIEKLNIQRRKPNSNFFLVQKSRHIIGSWLIGLCFYIQQSLVFVVILCDCW